MNTNLKGILANGVCTYDWNAASYTGRAHLDQEMNDICADSILSHRPSSPDCGATQNIEDINEQLSMIKLDSPQLDNTQSTAEPEPDNSIHALYEQIMEQQEIIKEQQAEIDRLKQKNLKSSPKGLARDLEQIESSLPSESSNKAALYIFELKREIKSLKMEIEQIKELYAKATAPRYIYLLKLLDCTKKVQYVYVGQTNDPERRIYEHKHSSHNDMVKKWTSFKLGNTIEMEIIDEVAFYEVDQIEQEYIEYYSNQYGQQCINKTHNARF